MNYLEEKGTSDSLKEDLKNSKKKKRLILRTQQRFKSERQLFDSVWTYVYGMSKDIICKDRKNKLINIIKGYKIWLTLMMLKT